ncbi:MAG: putative baseplate assembly protein [Methanomicrobiaceae archaeon]|nr:putative baseplate assembly protein [Methanomicrobiaceae archaeon]
MSARSDLCGCCEGMRRATPVRIYNRPGLRMISYRTGDHARFRASMMAALSGTERRPALAGLRTRESGDFSIALLDAWAVIGDVLTFYQERIANECYLRTATERLSLSHIAALTGYRLRPGAAAATYLAFTVESDLAAVPVGRGTRVQSIPLDGRPPLTFETVEEIAARTEWNAISPRLYLPQEISLDAEAFTIRGNAATVKPGDRILLAKSAEEKRVRTVTEVFPDTARGTVRVHLASAPPPGPVTAQIAAAPAAFISKAMAMTDAHVKSAVLDKRWQAADLIAFAAHQGWPLKRLKENMQMQRAGRVLAQTVRVSVFRCHTAPFGHNAPRYDMLPDDRRGGHRNWDDATLADDANLFGVHDCIHLDASYPGILPGSRILLKNTRTGEEVLGTVVQNEEVARSDYLISARVSRLRLDRAVPSFKIRETAISAQSEELEIAEVADTTPVEGDSVVLEGAYPELQKGQVVVLSGAPIDLRMSAAHEAVTIASVEIAEGLTLLSFSTALSHRYRRESVTINANVAAATHGETREEVLGSGDGRLSYQQFSLKAAPLTCVTSGETGSLESSLEIRVNDLLWREAESLIDAGPGDRCYTVRTEEDGTTTVTFGDGERGARLPSGRENVTATYRSGSGRAGNLEAERLTLLTRRPPGVRSVTNPLPASGGADAETLGEIRQNSPLAVLTLDRIVSIRDFASYARAFPGIAKAMAVDGWMGQSRAVLLTVAGPGGESVPPGGPTCEGLKAALCTRGDPRLPVRVLSFRPVFFQIRANVKTDPAYVRSKVLADAERAVREAFSFEAREFGQPVTISEVTGVIQSVPGVSAVEIGLLFRSDGQRGRNAVIVARQPSSGEDIAAASPAELLQIDQRPIEWGELA